MSDNLTQLVELIDKNKKVAESNAGSNPYTRRTKLGRIKRAKENLSELFLEYRKIIQERAVFICATGGQLGNFIDISKQSFGCFNVEAEDFYKEVIKDIDPRLYNNFPASRNLFELMNAGFEEMAMDIGIIGYNPILFESKFKKPLNGKKDLLDLTIRAFNEKLGSEVVGLYAVNKVAQEAVNQSYNNRLVPIIISTKDAALLKEISKGLRKYFNNIFIVSAGKVTKEIKQNSIASLKKVDEASVEKALIKVKENIN